VQFNEPLHLYPWDFVTIVMRRSVKQAPSLLPSFFMGVTGGNRFSAAGSALGYIVQVEYALLLALQKMDDDVSFRVSLETADDIAFEYEGSPVELWQTKHHIHRQGSLGNASPDLSAGQRGFVFLLLTRLDISVSPFMAQVETTEWGERLGEQTCLSRSFHASLRSIGLPHTRQGSPPVARLGALSWASIHSQYPSDGR
jgi:hypothetical protein